MIKLDEIRDLTIQEIDEKCENLRKDLLNLRTEAKMGKLEKTNRLRETRRDIARLMTVKTELLLKKRGEKPKK